MKKIIGWTDGGRFEYILLLPLMPVTVPVRGHSYSSKFPYCLILIVEIAHDVCCFGREVCRCFIDEIPICRVTFTGLDVPDDSTPPDLVKLLDSVIGDII